MDRFVSLKGWALRVHICVVLSICVLRFISLGLLLVRSIGARVIMSKQKFPMNCFFNQGKEEEEVLPSGVYVWSWMKRGSVEVNTLGSKNGNGQWCVFFVAVSVNGLITNRYTIVRLVIWWWDVMYDLNVVFVARERGHYWSWRKLLTALTPIPTRSSISLFSLVPTLASPKPWVLKCTTDYGLIIVFFLTERIVAVDVVLFDQKGVIRRVLQQMGRVEASRLHRWNHWFILTSVYQLWG